MWKASRRWTKETEDTQTGISLLLIFHFQEPSPLSYIVMTRSMSMAKSEHHERYGWWLNELDSLGIGTLDKNGLKNHKEASDLTEAVKQTLYEDYLQAYSESNQ